MVPKASGGWRPYWEYTCRCLNEVHVTIMDWYLVPRIQDLSANLTEAQVFFKIDLVKGDHQILVPPEDMYQRLQ